jgi:hypothetical protein
VYLQVQHLGVTISPLRPECWQSAEHLPSASPESMVTVVARISLGGIFDNPFTAWLMQFFKSSWLNWLLCSLVQVSLDSSEPRGSCFCAQDTFSCPDHIVGIAYSTTSSKSLLLLLLTSHPLFCWCAISIP